MGILFLSLSCISLISLCHCDASIGVRRTFYHNTSAPLLQHTLKSEGSLRLVKRTLENNRRTFTRTSYEGNVEIYHANRWGSICDDEWDLSEGDVVCRSLGFTYGAERVTHNGYFGHSGGVIWMSNLFCNGNETTLDKCPFDGWRVFDCQHSEIAGVICKREASAPTFPLPSEPHQAASNRSRTIPFIEPSQSPIKADARTRTLNPVPRIPPLIEHPLRHPQVHQSPQQKMQDSPRVQSSDFSFDQPVRIDDHEMKVHSKEHSEWRHSGERIPDQVARRASHFTDASSVTENTFDKESKVNYVVTGNVRLSGGESKSEGRVEVQVKVSQAMHTENDMKKKQQLQSDVWVPVCGDGWDLELAAITCHQLNLGHASNAFQDASSSEDIEKVKKFALVEKDQTSSAHGTSHGLDSKIFKVSCTGEESKLSQCNLILTSARNCSHTHWKDQRVNSAGVVCTEKLADLQPDIDELMSSVYLEDKHMILLQCAYEEHCLASSANSIDRSSFDWLFETRRLLRFTASIANTGTADFRPVLKKSSWLWHSCHRHYHSMEVFAHFDLYDLKSNHRVAEGHKASFCLEDNFCAQPSTPKFKCANFGDQGISVGCKDIYISSIDCQWIDITDILPGLYRFKMCVNPDMKAPEISFKNNCASCLLNYDLYSVHMTNCTLTSL